MGNRERALHQSIHDSADEMDAAVDVLGRQALQEQPGSHDAAEESLLARNRSIGIRCFLNVPS